MKLYGRELEKKRTCIWNGKGEKDRYIEGYSEVKSADTYMEGNRRGKGQVQGADDKLGQTLWQHSKQ